MRTSISSLLAGICVLVSVAHAQIGTVTVIGTTAASTDALAFNAGGVLYGATAGSLTAGSLYTINTGTGAATLVGALVGASNATLKYAITGLAFQPGTGTLYGATSKNSANSPNSLVTVNPATGQVTVIGPANFPTAQGPADITFTPSGTLYGWIEPNADGLATINLGTGQATLVGTSGFGTSGSGIASNSSGVIYDAGQGTGGALWTDSTVTGTPTTVGTLGAGNGSGDSVSALAFSPGGVLFGIENGEVTALITINTTGSISPTPVSPTWLLVAIGLVCLALYQSRNRLLALLRR